MEMHDNWCLKSQDGLHCFHMIIPDGELESVIEEICCWCGKKQLIHYITGSTYKPHGKMKDKYKCVGDDTCWK